MHTILLLLAVVVIYNCVDYLPDSITNWWENSGLKKWAYPAIVVVITVAVALGIHFNILIWAAAFFPVFLGFPYILGMGIGIWYNMKSAGLKATSKNETEAKEIVLKCLTALGCQPEICKDGSVDVKYQGEVFHFDCRGRYACIWDPMWAGVRADDPDMPKIREAVNVANFNFGPTVVLTAPNDEGIIRFYSRRDIMLHPACPDNVPFVKAMLDSFFDVKDHVHRYFHQINSQQQQENKTRRPVGFARS